MKQFWAGPAGRVAGKYGENAPMAAVCCNACRTCVSGNLVGIALAAVTGAFAAVAGFAPRFGRPS